MKYRLVLTSKSPDPLETLVLSMVKNPTLKMSRNVVAGPIEPVDAADPVRAALLAYRESHRSALHQPYADCTCYLCRAADLALNPVESSKVVQ